MTIVNRNKILITSIILSAILFLASLLCTIILYITNTIGHLPLPENSIIHLGAISLPTYNNDAVTFGTLVFAPITLVLLLSLFFLFEKTHAIEVSFFALFVFAVAFESLRLFFPLSYIYPITLITILPITRTVFFFRFFSLLSLLTASLFTHKVFTRNTMPIIFLLCFISAALAQTIPCNTTYTTGYYIFSQHYQHIFFTFTGITALFCVLSVLISGISRDIPLYRKSAINLLVMLCGYGGLLYTGTWTTILISTAAFFFGGLSFIRHLHHFYLWQ
ncbi:MAG: hypothetical protein ACTTH7_03380 [Treponema sp.]